jgi:aspartyl/asparaginyl beta-hydroxylase (cupin superfamily)
MQATMRIAAESALEIGTALLQVPGSGDPGKERVKRAVNSVFTRCEQAGLVAPLPAFDDEYRDYPELKVFEEQYAAIRAECESVLKIRESLTDISKLVGSYTAGGIHTIRWKALMLKAGAMIEENAKLCPTTASIVEKLPDVYTAFFSILEPNQYVTPHWGYFKGFVRYHLGVVIPNDNVDNKCWLRVNADPKDNALRDKALIERGHKHYWRNGKGFLFDDTALHDAANGSDEIRVVLWLDVKRKLPLPLDLYSRACIAAIALEPSIRRVRQNAVVQVAAR